GGYVPLLLAACVYGVMLIWHRGTEAVAHRLYQVPIPVPEFLANVKGHDLARVPGTAIFLTRSKSGVPPVMLWHLQHNRALHRFVVVLSIIMETKPRVPVLERLVVVREGENFW